MVIIFILKIFTLDFACEQIHYCITLFRLQDKVNTSMEI